ncbi:MAG: hypothetical protein ACPMAQ_11985 [Phycisphaerae bacterium]
MRLARYVGQPAREHPGSLIHLIGYSTGVYVAFEAVRRLAPAACPGGVADGLDCSCVRPVPQRGSRVARESGMGERRRGYAVPPF